MLVHRLRTALRPPRRHVPVMATDTGHSTGCRPEALGPCRTVCCRP